MRRLECPFPKRSPSALSRDDEYFMSLAYNEAIDGWRKDEVPIGAVVVLAGEVIGRAHNQVDSLRDPTAHAEILAIGQAARAVGDWRLNHCTLFVTKEPCPMCAGATVMARLGRVVYAVPDVRMGCLGGATDLASLPRSNHHPVVDRGILGADCLALLQAYFRMKRPSGAASVDEDAPASDGPPPSGD